MSDRADAPIVVEGAEHFVERNYREGGRFQWVRETLVNAIEADAKRVEYGTEWQGVEQHGVYRRTVADDGSGMTPEELREFFRTYGGSGRPIGGIHENFGIGAKCSLFPWNTKGLVIVSWHPDFEDPSMIWVRKDSHTGEYGLRTWDTDDGGENVIVASYDDELGIDWSLVKPEWIGDHGTVLILVGDELVQDTVLGDPNRSEGGVPGLGIVEYLNKRMWDLGDMTVRVDEYRKAEKTSWPKSASVSVKSELQLGRRKVEGAKYYIEYPPAQENGTGQIDAFDTLRLANGTEIDWFLWKGGGRDGIRNAAMHGFIAARYAPDDNRTYPELFDVVDHSSNFRAFGISETDVRRRLWLIARPPLAGKPHDGVYMSSDRNRLLIMGGARAGDPLPWNEWAIEFAENLPQPIVDAITEARSASGDTDLDESWRDRLAERFGRRWRQLRLILDPHGDRSADGTQPGGTPSPSGRPRRPTRRGGSGGGSGGTGGRGAVATSGDGSERARERRVAVGVPKWEWLADEEVFERGMFAVWVPPSPANPEGLVQLNLEHPVLQEEILHWTPQYPTHLEDDVIEVIKNSYAQIAVATVAHVEALKPHLHRSEIADEMRKPEALTAALLGLVGPAAMIAPHLGGALGRRRSERQEETATS